MIERLDAGTQAAVVRADAMRWLQAPLHGRFDVVFVDPPFEAGLWAGVLASLPPCLSDEALVYLETPLAQPVPLESGWVPLREGRTREVRYALYRRIGGPAATLAPDSWTGGAATA